MAFCERHSVTQLFIAGTSPIRLETAILLTYSYRSRCTLFMIEKGAHAYILSKGRGDSLIVSPVGVMHAPYVYHICMDLSSM